MKLLAVVVLSVCVLQTLAKPAVPETQNAPEQVPQKRASPVDAFREEVDRHFVRYQTRYDQLNFQMRSYRLNHVTLVTEIYNVLMTVLGDRIEEVRVAALELDNLITARRAQVGNNACVQGVQQQSDANSARVGGLIQACALYGNTTLSGLLLNTFYPTFALIQTQTSVIPISVVDILRKGNVLEDQQAILTYLDDRYRAIEMQWGVSVSQLLRWETSRFNVEGRFLSDQVDVCMGDSTWEYLLTNSRLEGEIQAC